MVVAGRTRQATTVSITVLFTNGMCYENAVVFAVVTLPEKIHTFGQNTVSMFGVEGFVFGSFSIVDDNC